MDGFDSIRDWVHLDTKQERKHTELAFPLGLEYWI